MYLSGMTLAEIKGQTKMLLTRTMSGKATILPNVIRDSLTELNTGQVDAVRGGREEHLAQ